MSRCRTHKQGSHTLISSISHLVLQNRLSSYSDMYHHTMSSSNAYSIQLPYLGTIPLGKSPPNLSSFQKPLRELYIPYYRQRRERYYDERRIIISDRDILIFEPDAASKGKRSLIYSTLESIVDIQALELYIMFNHTENHHHKRIRAAFLPIGCEDQERFRSLYSTIDKSQYNLLSTPSSTTSCHPPLILFVMKKTGTSGTCSLLDCHVFAVRRETIAFELCDMIRKLIIKRTMSPLLPTSKTKGTTLLRINENIKDINHEKNIKYLDRDRPISAMEHRNIDMEKKNDHLVPSNDMLHLTSNGLTNPLSTSSPFHIHNDTLQVLNMENDIHNSSSLCPPLTTTTTRTLRTKHHQPQQIQQRHFIKASSSTSSLVIDESDEVVNDLMNIVVQEKLKTIDTNSCQIPIKRHASFDHSSSSNGYNDHQQTINKKRYQFHHYQNQNTKKRSIILNSNPLPTIISANNTPVISRSTTTNVEQQNSSSSSIIDSHLLRTPQILINRYGDIGNYVPKLLRDNSTTMRSSDSNENIFFRATNGHILNGFLNLDFSSTPQTVVNGNLNNNNNSSTYYRSSPCLNEDNSEKNNIYPFMKQFKRNQTKTFIHEKDLSIATNQTYPMENGDHDNDDHHVPPSRMPRVILQSQLIKPPTAMGGIKVLPSTSHQHHQHHQHLQRPLKTSYSTPNTKPKRVASFTIANTELPIDYRQYLRHTDQGVYLYGEEQQQQQQQQQKLATLEHSLGYYP